MQRYKLPLFLKEKKTLKFVKGMCFQGLCYRIWVKHNIGDWEDGLVSHVQRACRASMGN